MKTKIFLITIILIASLLRLYKLGSIPPHLTPDEAALGYNAYSILKTGKDEYGVTLPIIFKSFGDYKPGLYVYTAIPSIALLGLNEFSTRMPSAIAGIFAVILLYLIIKSLFKNEKLALLSGFLLAISPWHLHFSRGAWEISTSLTLTLAGIYFFMLALKRQKFFVLSVVFFALTLLAYQGAKLSTGIVVILLATLWGKQLIHIPKRTLIISTVVGFVISLPIILSLFQAQTGRLTVFSVFSYPRPEKYLQDFLDQGSEQVGDVTYYLFHSEKYNFLRGVLGRYFNHFSGRFLFFEGDWSNPRHSSPYHGVLLLSDILLLAAGVVYLTQEKIKREHLFIILWLCLAPLPSILSRDQVHAVRSFNMVIPLVAILAMGLSYLNKRFLFLVSIGMITSYIYFMDAYFIHLPSHNSKLWEYGYKQIVETVTPIQNNYKKITVQQSYAQPYIYFLFFKKYDPAKYQSIAKLKESEFGDVGQVEKLDNICFCAIDWSVNRGEKGTLVVGDPVRIPPQDSKDEKQFRLIKEIYYLNGVDTAFRILEIKQ